METLVVITREKDWPHSLPGVRVVTAQSYLMDAEFSKLKRAKVFNLCRQYKYQSLGYYVSLLAEARGHKPFPTVMTMQDLRTPSLTRMASEEVDSLMQKSLASLQSDTFDLSIYFGKNLAKKHDKLSNALFKLFPAPLLRATFVRHQKWELQNITAIPMSGIPEPHREFVVSAATEFFSHSYHRPRTTVQTRFDLAILWDPSVITCPSDQKAIDKFIRAGSDLGIAVEIIGKQDYGRLAEFDGLFIRATTAVNHYTYRFARRAEAEGLVVIDDPTSILRCTNKVYLADLLTKNGIPTPKTRILFKDNLDNVMEDIGFPCILKQPDSSSSLGVEKADNEAESRSIAAKLFDASDLLIAQEFLPTAFDWRIGVLDRKPFYVAKYFMAARHWQIAHYDKRTGDTDYGLFECLAVEDVPSKGLKLALKAANLIGDGLYGVDLKQIGNQWYVIEVNDNPSLEHKIEDRYYKDEVYRKVMRVFLRRMEKRKEARNY